MQNTEFDLAIGLVAYNAENSISIPLNSLKKAISKNMEIIIINDCSCDNTDDIVCEFIKDNPEFHIKYITNSINLGCGPSKNIFIENVNAKYFSFIDADDWVEENYYRRLLNIVLEDNEIDVVRCGCVKVNYKKREIMLPPVKKINKYISPKEYIGKYNITSMLDFPYTQLGIYKTSYINKYNIRCDDLITCEDRLFQFNIAANNAKIYISDEFGYFYDKTPNPNSLTQMVNTKQTCFVDAYIRLIDIARKLNNQEYLNKIIRQAVALIEWHSKKKFNSDDRDYFMQKSKKLIEYLTENELDFLIQTNSNSRINLINKLLVY